MTTNADPVIPRALLNTSADFGKANSLTYTSTTHDRPASDIARLTFPDTSRPS